MRILFLSDLHMTDNCYMPLDNSKRMLGNVRDRTNPDVVAISGDVHEFDNKGNPYKALAGIFRSVPVVFCLGNHEFLLHTVQDTLERYKNQYNPGKYDVHCLDVLGHWDFRDVRFVGNVLWYDGSMSTIKNQDLYNWGDYSWADRLIKKFDFAEENRACQEQILAALKLPSEGVNHKILLTHCVPHYGLNWHMFKENSPYNAYSGNRDFLKQVKDLGVEYAVSGHTHKKMDGEIYGIKCRNVGSDYLTQSEVTYWLLEL